MLKRTGRGLLINNGKGFTLASHDMRTTFRKFTVRNDADIIIILAGKRVRNFPKEPEIFSRVKSGQGKTESRIALAA